MKFFSFNTLFKSAFVVNASQWNYDWDEKENLKDNSKKSKARRHIILIRHGQYVHKSKYPDEQILTALGSHRWQADDDLNPRYLMLRQSQRNLFQKRKEPAQAQETGLHLLDSKLHFDRIIQSNLVRAKETAKIITNAIGTKAEIHTDSDLNEGFPCVPEPCFSNDLKTRTTDASRIDRAFERYFYRPDANQTKDSYDLIICHANVIRYFVCRALQLPTDVWLRMSLNHGSMVWITILADGRVLLRQFSDSGFMSFADVTR